MITTAVSTVLASTPAATAHGNLVLTNCAGPTSGYTFNVRTLPDDLTERYDACPANMTPYAWAANTTQLGRKISSVYASGNYYYDGGTSANNVATERIFLADALYETCCIQRPSSNYQL